MTVVVSKLTISCQANPRSVGGALSLPRARLNRTMDVALVRTRWEPPERDGKE